MSHMVLVETLKDKSTDLAYLFHLSPLVVTGNSFQVLWDRKNQTGFSPQVKGQWNNQLGQSLKYLPAPHWFCLIKSGLLEGHL